MALGPARDGLIVALPQTLTGMPIGARNQEWTVSRLRIEVDQAAAACRWWLPDRPVCNQLQVTGLDDRPPLVRTLLRMQTAPAGVGRVLVGPESGAVRLDMGTHQLIVPGIFPVDKLRTLLAQMEGVGNLVPVPSAAPVCQRREALMVCASGNSLLLWLLDPSRPERRDP